MKVHDLHVALLFVACAALAACSVGAHSVPGSPSSGSGGLHTQGGQPPEDGGGDDGSDGTATPAPLATPDAAGEDACNVGGGKFYDDVGGAGLLCAGGRNGPGETISRNNRCGFTITLNASFGRLSKDGSVLDQDFTKGIEVFSDCSYNLIS